MINTKNIICNLKVFRQRFSSGHGSNHDYSVFVVVYYRLSRSVPKTNLLLL